MWDGGNPGQVACTPLRLFVVYGFHIILVHRIAHFVTANAELFCIGLFHTGIKAARKIMPPTKPINNSVLSARRLGRRYHCQTRLIQPGLRLEFSI